MFTSHLNSENEARLYYGNPNASSVFVVGDFNGWKPPGIKMERVDCGWTTQAPGIPIGEYSYKFIVDGGWDIDPNNVMKDGGSYGSENSILFHRIGRGNIYHFEFHSPSINQLRGYTIYLPPGYFYDSKRYSTVYLMHGLLDWEYTWVHRGFLHHTMDQLIKNGKVGEMIVVMPRENGEFFKGNGMFADYIFQDLVGHIDMEFRTIARREHRAIDGLSTGGFSSIVIGASHSDVFSSIGGMSGSYDQRTFDAIEYNLDALKESHPRFYISCGQSDPSCGVSGDLAQAIRSNGLECEFYANPGPHDWEFWGPSVAGNLEFHWWSFQK